MLITTAHFQELTFTRTTAFYVVSSDYCLGKTVVHVTKKLFEIVLGKSISWFIEESAAFRIMCPTAIG
jgi:hypothetical protein